MYSIHIACLSLPGFVGVDVHGGEKLTNVVQRFKFLLAALMCNSLDFRKECFTALRPHMVGSLPARLTLVVENNDEKPISYICTNTLLKTQKYVYIYTCQ